MSALVQGDVGQTKLGRCTLYPGAKSAIGADLGESTGKGISMACRDCKQVPAVLLGSGCARAECFILHPLNVKALSPVFYLLGQSDHKRKNTPGPEDDVDRACCL